jgi:hypothetical protein
MLNFSGEVKRRDHKSLKRKVVYKQATLILNGAASLIEDLEDYFSVTEDKSQILMPPLLLDDDLLKCYIIGLIDGDGNIGNNNRSSNNTLLFSLVGTYEILEFIRQKFDLWYPSFRSFSVFQKGKIYVINIRGRRANQILSGLSTQEVPFLMRKWQKVFYL